MVEIIKKEYLCRCKHVIFNQKNVHNKYKCWSNLKVYQIKMDKVQNCYIKKHISDYNVIFETMNCANCDQYLGCVRKHISKENMNSKIIEYQRNNIIKRTTILTVMDEIDENYKKMEKFNLTLFVKDK